MNEEGNRNERKRKLTKKEKKKTKAEPTSKMKLGVQISCMVIIFPSKHYRLPVVLSASSNEFLMDVLCLK